jgi:hypothetical protein
LSKKLSLELGKNTAERNKKSSSDLLNRAKFDKYGKVERAIIVVKNGVVGLNPVLDESCFKGHFLKTDLYLFLV